MLVREQVSDYGWAWFKPKVAHRHVIRPSWGYRLKPKVRQGHYFKHNTIPASGFWRHILPRSGHVIHPSWGFRLKPKVRHYRGGMFHILPVFPHPQPQPSTTVDISDIIKTIEANKNRLQEITAVIGKEEVKIKIPMLSYQGATITTKKIAQPISSAISFAEQYITTKSPAVIEIVIRGPYRVNRILYKKTEKGYIKMEHQPRWGVKQAFLSYESQYIYR
jgi:hypothetical protein